MAEDNEPSQVEIIKKDKNYLKALIMDVIVNVLIFTSLILRLFTDPNEDNKDALCYLIPSAFLVSVTAQYFGWKGFLEGNANYFGIFVTIKFVTFSIGINYFADFFQILMARIIKSPVAEEEE